MGNVLAIPESMKLLPDNLKENEYVKITTNLGEHYYVFSRSIFKTMGANLRNEFTQENFALKLLGGKLGLGSQLVDLNQSMNQQKNSRFYITQKSDPKSPAIPSSVDASDLKGYIKLFHMDPRVEEKHRFDLDTSTFELKQLKSDSKKNQFGTSRIEKGLQHLQRDLKQVLKC
jgi:hypothetical protein